MRVIFNLFLLLLLLTLPTHTQAQPSLPEDKSSAVILAYQRIGEDAHPQSSLQTQTFKDHLTEIRNGDYTIIPIPELASALRANAPLPQKTIAITLDGSFRSTFNNAIKPLLEHDIPFTLMITPQKIGQGNHLNWAEIKKLQKNKTVTLGILPTTRTHIAQASPAEQRHHINKARSLFREKLNTESRYFAYPFGETSETLKTIIKEQKFDAAFGLQSGAAYAGSNPIALPRFTMTDQYGDIDRFRLVTNALPLPVSELSQTPPIGFTLPETLNPKNLRCFISGQEKPTLETLGARVEIRPKDPIESRTRINCTLPGPKTIDDNQKWRWLGMLLHNKAKP